MSTGKNDRHRKLDQKQFDVIVIGAGIGGLTAAGTLANSGKRVLVLDMHYELGGCATVFHRGGTSYEFDVGLHYIGDCAKDGLIPRILEGCGINYEDINFIEQDPDGFDTLVYPDYRFSIPKGINEFKAKLLSEFPNEEKGINRYCKFLDQTYTFIDTLSNPISFIWRFPKLSLFPKYAHSTVENFLDSCTSDEKLRAVLTGQLGVYHQPASRASMVGHAAVVNHFLQGSFYPSGGGQVFSNKLGDVIEKNGGKILLRSKASKILVENGKAIGVNFQNKHLGDVNVYADAIISNADIKNTYINLLKDAPIKQRTLKKVEGYDMSPAMGVLYLGVEMDLFKMGYKNTNYRLYPSFDYEKGYAEIFNDEFPEEPHIFIGNATLKDPDNPELSPAGVCNMQVMSAVPSKPESWGVTQAELDDGSYRQNPDYVKKKEEYAAQLIESLEAFIPGVKDHIVFQEVSTPFSVTRYIGSSNGTSYGISLTPDQFLLKRPGPKTEIKNLFLCGASLRNGHGIFGAMTGGVEAASMIVGSKLKSKLVYLNERA